VGIAFLFGGPGLGEAGMGKDLYNKNPGVRESVDKADKVMNELGGVRITKAAFAGDLELIKRPSVGGPAALALAHGVMRTLKAKRIYPNYAAGLGWGELVAMTALGGLDFDAGLKLLYERGLKVEEAWSAAPWHALSVVGLAPEALESKLAALPEPPVRAALIGADQFVLTGSEALLKKLHTLLSAAGRGVKVTPVEPGWHWPHPSLAPVGEWVKAQLDALPKEHLSTPLQGAEDAEAARQTREWPARGIAHTSKPWDWLAACRRLKAMGMDTAVEIGHGGALGAALHAADHDVRVLATEDIASLAQTIKLSNQ
jgi:[acyl-carrier-protein] S-malonyltransferase